MVWFFKKNQKELGVLAFAITTLIGLTLSPSIPVLAQTPSEKLKELRASDQELVAAMADLDKQVLAKRGEVADATEAIMAAERTIAVSNERIAELDRRRDRVTEQARQLAINEYTSPKAGFMDHLANADGPVDASRKAEIVDQISGSNYSILDELRAINSNLEKERSQAQRAMKLAEQSRDDANRALDELQKTKAEKEKLSEDIKKRIEEAKEEDEIARRPDPASSNIVISATGLRWPVDGAHKVTSPFGPRWGRFHSGIDIAATSGTPVKAVKDGTVTFAGWEGGYGNYVCVQHGGGFQTCVGHNSRLTVRAGQSVSQGQLLAYSGSTGHSTGPHLHFETCASTGPSCIYGTMKNPLNYLP